MTLCATTWTTTTRTWLRLGRRVRFRVWGLNRRPQKTAGRDRGEPRDGDQRRIIAERCSSELIAAVIGRVASPQHHQESKIRRCSGLSPTRVMMGFSQKICEMCQWTNSQILAISALCILFSVVRMPASHVTKTYAVSQRRVRNVSC